MSDETNRVVGSRIAVGFEAKKCIHSRSCVLSRPDVFVPGAAGEWIHPDAATPDEVAAEVRACPSGALTFQRLDGGPEEAMPRVNVIRVLENGPLAFVGDLRIAGQPPMKRAALCRCGKSANKPFCDAAHRESGFRATGEPDAEDLPQLPSCDGPLEIKPAVDGPLILAGNFELCSGTGRKVAQGKKAALCRCGHSRRKPLCDGSHFTADFAAP